MERIVPGHARAYTLPLLGTMAVILLLLVESKTDVVWTLLAFASVFLGDQATHLHQADHSGLPPTWLERKMQRHTIYFQVLGIALAVNFIRIALS